MILKPHRISAVHEKHGQAPILQEQVAAPSSFPSFEANRPASEETNLPFDGTTAPQLGWLRYVLELLARSEALAPSTVTLTSRDGQMLRLSGGVLAGQSIDEILAHAVEIQQSEGAQAVNPDVQVFKTSIEQSL